MKKVTIKNLAGTQTHGAEMEDPTAWIAECVDSNAWGKPERWVLHKDEPMAEAYDDADVLEEEIRPNLDGSEQKWVKLKAEYTVSIVDLDQDPTWLLQKCHEKRVIEYPPLGEFADAYVKLQQGDSSQMEAYVLKCIEVKNKYPKP